MNKGKKNKKENDTFARFPSLRNANLLEFNFKVRETKQNKKRKCTREEEEKNTVLTFRFSFRPPLCTER